MKITSNTSSDYGPTTAEISYELVILQRDLYCDHCQHETRHTAYESKYGDVVYRCTSCRMFRNNWQVAR